MNRGGGLKGLFTAIGIIDFIAGIIIFVMLLQGANTSFFIYMYYGLFVVIGIGVVNAVLAMVIPAIRGNDKAVPGFVFSLIGSAICVFAFVLNQNNLDLFKKNEQEKEEKQKQDDEEEAKVSWLSIAGLEDDALNEEQFNELVSRYATYKPMYQGASAGYQKNTLLTFDRCTDLFKDGAQYAVHKNLAEQKINTQANAYDFRSTPVELEHTFQEGSETGTVVVAHSYFSYGNFGYLHLQETISTKTSTTSISQVFEYVNDQGYLSRLGFVETVRANGFNNEYFGSQLVYDISYYGLNS